MWGPLPALYSLCLRLSRFLISFCLNAIATVHQMLWGPLNGKSHGKAAQQEGMRGLLLALYSLYLRLSHLLISLCIDAIAIVYQHLRDPLNGESRGQAAPQEVVVVGGGFAGILAARSISDQCRVFGVQAKVTLLDQKQFFEYTPAILRAMAHPEECQTILIPFADTCLHSSGVTFKQAKVDGIDPEAKVVQYSDAAGAPGKQPYNVLLLANGTPYASKAIRDWTSVTLEQREAKLSEEYWRLQEANCVVIAGGATSGVELAAEVVSVLPTEKGKPKQVYLISAGDRLLPCSPSLASEYAYMRLEQQGVKIILNEMVINVTELPGSSGVLLSLQSGRTLQCDVFYLCAMFGTPAINGIHSNPGGIPVNLSLQVDGQTAVFAAGDAVEAPLVCGCGADRCGKSAYVAENTAAVAAKNIVRLLRGHQGPLTHFPGTLAARLPTVECISLGRWDGIIIVNSLAIPGPLSAPVKLLIKYSKLDDVNGGILGRAFWLTLDALAPFLGRVVPVNGSGPSHTLIVKPRKEAMKH